MTAGIALERMSGREFGAYVQGIVEGLSQSRYEADGDESGMQCIHDWFYGDDSQSALKAVIDAFEKYPNHSPGAVMSGLVRKECPS